MRRRDCHRFPLRALALLTILGGCFPSVLHAREETHYLQPLHRSLEESRAGRALLEALAGQGDERGVVGLDLLVGRIEIVVGSYTGLMLDGGDAGLIEAAGALKKMPRRLRNEPMAAVMVMIDQWVAENSQCDSSDRLVDRLKKRGPPKDSAETCRWLDEEFPIIFRAACYATRHLECNDDCCGRKMIPGGMQSVQAFPAHQQ